METLHPSATGRRHFGAEPLLITMEALQATIGCGKTTAFAIVARGDIETVLVGRRRMPVFESVKAYVQRLRDDQAKVGDGKPESKAA